MKTKVEKNEAAMKEKDVEIKKVHLKMTKMTEALKKNGEELEGMRKKAADVEEASKIEIEALQAQVVMLKNESNGWRLR